MFLSVAVDCPEAILKILNMSKKSSVKKILISWIIKKCCPRS
jgi:hypothetical protein